MYNTYFMTIQLFTKQLKSPAAGIFYSFSMLCEPAKIRACIQKITFGEWMVWPPAREK